MMSLYESTSHFIHKVVDKQVARFSNFFYERDREHDLKKDDHLLLHFVGNCIFIKEN